MNLCHKHIANDGMTQENYFIYVGVEIPGIKQEIVTQK